LFSYVINVFLLILLGVVLVYWLFFTCEMTFKMMSQMDPTKVTLAYFLLTVTTNMFYFVPKKVFTLLVYCCDVYTDKFQNETEWVDE